MQSLNLLLAVLLLTGAQARYFWQHDEPHRSRLDQLQELGQVYLESAKTAVQQAVVQFDSSALAQEMQVSVGPKLEALAIVLQEIKQQVTPGLQEMGTELQTTWQNLREELTKDVGDLRVQIQPLVRKLQENVQQEVATYFQQASTIYQEINQAAREKMTPVAEGFRDKVQHHVDEFRKDATPYAQKLEQLIKEKATLLEQNAQTEFAQLELHLSEAREKYGPLWEKLKQELLSLKASINHTLFGIGSSEQEAQQQSS